MTTNGRRAYRVRPSQAFKDKLAARSEYQPRLDRVLEGVRWALGCNPYYMARNVVGNIWVVETPRDIEAPLLWVYYTIDGEDVTLQGYHIVQDWEG